MAVSTIKNTAVKRKTVTLNNLQNYSGGTYYKEVPISTLGLPSGATPISMSLSGWAGLGTNPGVGFNGSTIYVFFTNNTSIGSGSYITVLVSYI